MTIPSPIIRSAQWVCQNRWKLLLGLLLLVMLTYAFCWAIVGINAATFETLPESPAAMQAL